MKKLLAAIILLTAVGAAHASHRARFNASNINAGILSPSRVEPSTFTLLGPSIEGSEITDNSITETKLSGAIFSRSYDFIIASAGVAGANFTGNDRTPFVNAISSVALTTKNATIFVRRGTYTVDTIASDGIDWVFEQGVVFRRQVEKQMWRIKNGSFDGGMFISTCAATVDITTAAILLEGRVNFKNVTFALAQTNQKMENVFIATGGFVEITSGSYVVVDNLHVSSGTSFYTGAGSRFMAIYLSTVVIRNSYLNVNADYGILAQHSNVRLFNSEIDNRGGTSMCVIDVNTNRQPSQYVLQGNRIHSRIPASAAGFLDASNSTGSIIANNEFVLWANDSYAIYLQGGGLANFSGISPSKTHITGNTAYSGDGALKTTADFILIDSDSNKSVTDVFLVGNQISNAGGNFLVEAGTVVNTGMKSNRKNGTAVTDQN